MQTESYLIIGNWKMFGSLSENEKYLEVLFSKLENLHSNVKCGLAVPFPYLFQFSSRLLYPNFLLGSQNVSKHLKMGAFTGEVSASMISEFDCSFTIVGHSERRVANKENDEDIANKTLCLLEKKILPVVCIGESQELRNSGESLKFIESQIDTLVKIIGVEKFKLCTLAYEPLWAIGTGKSADPEVAQEMHNFIRNLCKNYVGIEASSDMKIIYGGSVKSSNVMKLLSQKDINGALVGGASINAVEFVKILNLAESLFN